MTRAEFIEKKPYDVTEYNGETYILLNDAYGEWLDGKYPYYQALAIKEGEQPNEYNEVPVYHIIWYVKDEYTEWDYDNNCYTLNEDAPEEESDYCDWGTPSDVSSDEDTYGVMDADGWIS